MSRWITFPDLLSWNTWRCQCHPTVFLIPPVLGGEHSHLKALLLSPMTSGHPQRCEVRSRNYDCDSASTELDRPCVLNIRNGIKQGSLDAETRLMTASSASHLRFPLGRRSLVCFWFLTFHYAHSSGPTMISDGLKALRILMSFVQAHACTPC